MLFSQPVISRILRTLVVKLFCCLHHRKPRLRVVITVLWALVLMHNVKLDKMYSQNAEEKKEISIFADCCSRLQPRYLHWVFVFFLYICALTSLFSHYFPSLFLQFLGFGIGTFFKWVTSNPLLLLKQLCFLLHRLAQLEFASLDSLCRITLGVRNKSQHCLPRTKQTSSRVGSFFVVTTSIGKAEKFFVGEKQTEFSHQSGANKEGPAGGLLGTVLGWLPGWKSAIFFFFFFDENC